MNKIVFLMSIFIISGCVDNSNAARGYRQLKSQEYNAAAKTLKLSVAEKPDSQLSTVNLAWAYQNIGEYKKSLNLYLYTLGSMKNCKLPNPQKAAFKNKPISDLIVTNLSVLKADLTDKADIDRINQMVASNAAPLHSLKKCK